MSAGQLLDVRLDELDGGPNIRHADDGLVASIRAHGLLQPITVAHHRGRFQILYGHRRAAAARKLGLESVPAILVQAPADLPLSQLAENLDRKGVDRLDVARALQSVLNANPGMTQADLAVRIGRSSYFVSTKLALLGMDAETQRRVSSGELSELRAQSIRKASTSQTRRSRPRLLEVDPDDDGRSRSIVVELGTRHGPGSGAGARATIGVDHADTSVDVVFEDGAGAILSLTLTPERAALLGRRFVQASVAVKR